MRLHTTDQARPRRISIAGLLASAVGILALAGGCGSSGSSSATTSSSVSTPATTSASTGTPATTTAQSTSTSATTPSTTASAPASTLSLAANPEGQLKYDKTSLTVKAAGKIFAIDFTNMSPISHNVTVASTSGQVIYATPTFQGGSQTLKLKLRAGTYKFYCSIIGHRKAGMEGTLTVN